jgi:hypothetical protein
MNYKCIDCGYLAVRNLVSGELVEVERDENGNINEGKYFGSPRYDLPICFARETKLQPQYKTELIIDDPIHKKLKSNVNNVLAQPRLCNSFTKWQMGFTPKEHREMLDEQWRLSFQAKREDEDRKWREEQRKSDLEWRVEQEKKATRSHRWDLIFTGGIATFLICVATIVAAFITRGH